MTVTPDMLIGAAFWVACATGDESVVLGSASLAEQDGIGEVDTMYVAPDAQGRGIGRQLWDKIEALGLARGLLVLRLDADPFAVPFYQAMGMAVIGEAPSGSIPGRMLPRMEKSL